MLNPQVYAFDFILRPEQNLHCSPYKGSMLRGLLGWSLKKITCINTNGNCLICPVKDKCPYYICFEGSGLHDGGQRDVSHPFVINCLDKRTMIRAGELLSFELLLLGKSLHYLNYFVYAFVKGGSEYGLGNSAVKFNLEGVFNKGINLLDEDQNLQNMDKVHPLSLRALNSDNCILEFITPARLKSNGRYCGTDLDSEGLIKGIYHSLEGLKPWFDDMSLPEKGEFLALHKKLQVQNISLHWKSVKRYSNRQQSRMSMGGVLGGIRLSGVSFSVLKPWLSLLELTNIGKNRVFGFGKFRLENENLALKKERDAI